MALIRVYQATISSWRPPSCKYYPSCSTYTVDAIRKYGIVKGAAKGTWRILRCNPFSHGGYDPA